MTNEGTKFILSMIVSFISRIEFIFCLLFIDITNHMCFNESSLSVHFNLKEFPKAL